MVTFSRLLNICGFSVFAFPCFSEPMAFHQYCLGNSYESCFYQADGEITAETPATFNAFMQSERHAIAGKIFLNSPGGNLVGGLELGKLIRSAKLATYVGDASGATLGDWPTKGVCASACAYAFLGGETRFLPEGSMLGFHQHHSVDRIDLTRSSDSQILSALLVAYIVDMGVDARVFITASATLPDAIYWIDGVQAEEYNITTPYGFGRFFLEPYKSGILAAAKRKTPAQPYDYVYQVTAFCRASSPYLLFTAESVPERSVQFSIRIDEAEISVPPDRVQSRNYTGMGTLEVRLTRGESVRVTSANRLQTSFNFSRAEGGIYHTSLELDDMDRKMIEAAFRLCW